MFEVYGPPPKPSSRAWDVVGTVAWYGALWILLDIVKGWLR